MAAKNNDDGFSTEIGVTEGKVSHSHLKIIDESEFIDTSRAAFVTSSANKRRFTLTSRNPHES